MTSHSSEPQTWEVRCPVTHVFKNRKQIVRGGLLVIKCDIAASKTAMIHTLNVYETSDRSPKSAYVVTLHLDHLSTTTTQARDSPVQYSENSCRLEIKSGTSTHDLRFKNTHDLEKAVSSLLKVGIRCLNQDATSSATSQSTTIPRSSGAPSQPSGYRPANPIVPLSQDDMRARRIPSPLPPTADGSIRPFAIRMKRKHSSITLPSEAATPPGPRPPTHKSRRLPPWERQSTFPRAREEHTGQESYLSDSTLLKPSPSFSHPEPPHPHSSTFHGNSEVPPKRLLPFGNNRYSTIPSTGMTSVQQASSDVPARVFQESNLASVYPSQLEPSVLSNRTAPTPLVAGTQNRDGGLCVNHTLPGNSHQFRPVPQEPSAPSPSSRTPLTPGGVIHAQPLSERQIDRFRDLRAKYYASLATTPKDENYRVQLSVNYIREVNAMTREESRRGMGDGH